MAKIEYKLDIGHIVTLFVMLLTFAAGWGKISSDLDWIKKQGEKNVVQAERNSVQIEALEQRTTRIEQLAIDSERRGR